MSYIQKKFLIFPILMAMFLVIANVFHGKSSKPLMKVSKQESSLNFDKGLFQFMNLGYKRMITDMLWILTLMESDTEHYQKDDLNSWLFLRFKSITFLDPLFLQAYQYGGTYLSVVKNDLAGASELFTMGLVHYPDDWKLNFFGGMHFLIEIGDTEKALKLLKKVEFHPYSPPNISSIIAKITAKTGDLFTSFEILMTAYNRMDDKRSFMADRYVNSLYAIKAEIDLNCLNHKGPTWPDEVNGRCKTEDLEGRAYRKVPGRDEYRAERKWVPFRPSEANKKGP